MADSSNTRGTVTYAALVAAIVIPFVQKKFGVVLTVENVMDCMALLAVAWHGVSTFIESRWPPKGAVPVTPEAVAAIVRGVLAQTKQSSTTVQQ